MRWVYGWVVVACLLSAPAFGADQAAIQGTLTVREGTATLRAGERNIALTSSRPSILATLGDSRISGKQLKLLGHYRPDGSFDAQDFFVVHSDGSLFRLIYFCNVCNITSFSPGDCACCQAPTVPTEILPTDPRVYHDEVIPKSAGDARNR